MAVTQAQIEAVVQIVVDEFDADPEVFRAFCKVGRLLGEQTLITAAMALANKTEADQNAAFMAQMEALQAEWNAKEQELNDLAGS